MKNVPCHSPYLKVPAMLLTHFSMSMLESFLILWSLYLPMRSYPQSWIYSFLYLRPSIFQNPLMSSSTSVRSSSLTMTTFSLPPSSPSIYISVVSETFLTAAVTLLCAFEGLISAYETLLCVFKTLLNVWNHPNCLCGPAP